MFDRTMDFLITLLTQHCVPQRSLSRLMHALTRSRMPAWKNWQIQWFIRRYNVDINTAVEPDTTRYPDFNSFFTRQLKADARPIASDSQAIVSPADGTVSQAGDIVGGRLFQAKGRYFDLNALLGGDKERAAAFYGGKFVTIYLSPGDYHRLHMPIDGTLLEMVHIPGKLFSVQPRTTRSVPNLFARNERAIAFFDTPCGPMAMVLVGAMFVGSIETVWSGPISPSSNDPSTTKPIQVWNYRENERHTPMQVAKGAEMGRFNMGSTVILLFGPDQTDWIAGLGAGSTVKMGQCISTCRRSGKPVT